MFQNISTFRKPECFRNVKTLLRKFDNKVKKVLKCSAFTAGMYVNSTSILL